MASLADVFRELNMLRATGVVRDYAVGRATAVAAHGITIEIDDEP